MNYLIASLLILAVGPLLFHALRGLPRFLDSITAFVMVTLAGLILFDILPSLWRLGGPWILPFLLLGVAGPTLAERGFQRISGLTHNLTLSLGLMGLMLHTLTDGSALALASQAQGHPLLALGVVLHRLPAGLAVWWLLRPAFGRTAASAALGLMMLCTVLGFTLGETVLAPLASTELVWLQAFVTGSILHVLLHRPHEHQHEADDHRHGLQLSTGHYLGAAIGLLFLALLMLSHGTHDHHPGHSHDHSEHPH
ncbi:ZIP family metal transporter [Ferrimonas marina]|uniref:Zinc transporter ZupT n=1 Tax=Ferrimonas marina TaxID=299255 RepID=A0A1M5XQ29_9GAMM|nr:hypothetical protein [Ferrimonas marina]SHI01373.1 hypothetical protein SAMN02745129_3559 [Ferrimonas marina]